MKKRLLRFGGSDVSTDQVDLACRPEHTRGRVANDRAGIAECVLQRRQLTPPRLVLEATGGWQCALGAALAVAQWPCAVVNRRPLRDVAKATGPWAKTDALEAKILAHLAEAVRPTPRPLPAATPPRLDAVLQRRRQRLERWVAERHRGALAHPLVRDSLGRQIDDRQRLIDETDEELSSRTRASPAWQAQDAW